MKTKEEAAEELANAYCRKSDEVIDLKRSMINEYIYTAFKDGVEFAQRWIPVEEELPEMSDNEEDWIFDEEIDDEPVKFSKDVLIKDKYGNVAMGCMYEDGDWLSEYIIMDKPITHWRPIEIK